ncbi:hypothetical protein KY290_010813 [Solanum tuberosum]|uniref:RNA helicase n=1 Tax=Solanum tuberosum TaxID=4113 RepID=A0ABQ7VYV3_SOLTU|nr:hypothetical protein KY290_010813 [Solanum tuberosum]
MVFDGKGRVGDICMLLSFGVDCHLRANDGKTALDWAEQENQTEAVEIIKEHMEKSSSNCCRKIVLSTNIAETAITIDDVVYVIDSGRMKEKRYDSYNNVSTLQSSWVSKASAKQREGRVGQCQPGICYHLYLKLRAASVPDFQVPEIKRIHIEELCLQLGERLGSFPVHLLTSKMILISILLNYLDPTLTMACAFDYRDPFTLPMLPNEKKRASTAKAELGSWYGGRSDQLAVVAAFEGWKSAKETGQESRFCSKYFVSLGTMHMLSGMRILHAVLVAGLYPMVGRLLPPLKSNKKVVIETAGGDKVRLSPHSTNFKLSFQKFYEQSLITYDEITRGDGGLLIRNCSVFGPLPLLLLATEIVVAPGNEDDDDGNDDDESNYEDVDEDNGEEGNIKADLSEAHQGIKMGFATSKGR